jgi:hypothetical protein
MRPGICGLAIFGRTKIKLTLPPLQVRQRTLVHTSLHVRNNVFRVEHLGLDCLANLAGADSLDFHYRHWPLATPRID